MMYGYRVRMLAEDAVTVRPHFTIKNSDKIGRNPADMEIFTSANLVFSIREHVVIGKESAPDQPE